MQITMVMGSCFLMSLIFFSNCLHYPNYETFPGSEGVSRQCPGQSRKGQAAFFPWHAAMKPISIESIHNPWIVCMEASTMWREEVNLHECSSVSLSRKWNWPDESTHLPDLWLHGSLGGSSVRRIEQGTWGWKTQIGLFHCTEADREREMSNSTDPVVS